MYYVGKGKSRELGKQVRSTLSKWDCLGGPVKRQLEQFAGTRTPPASPKFPTGRGGGSYSVNVGFKRCTSKTGRVVLCLSVFGKSILSAVE